MPENEQKKLSDLKGQIKRLEREAQIEAALERVRARAMAMHRSDELREVVVLVFKQLQRLGFDVRQCEIIIFDKETLGWELWGSGFTKTGLYESYRIPFLDHP